MTTFPLSANNILTTLAVNHTLGSPNLVVASAAGMPNPTGGQSFKLAVWDSFGAFTIYAVTNVSGTSLTVAPIEGTSDHAYSIGDKAAIGLTSGDFTAIATAVNTLERRAPKVTALSQYAVADLDILNRTKIGGGSATDNQAAINALLSGATATAPALIDVDGAFGIHGAVIIPAGGHVEIVGHGWDTGFGILAGATDMAIRSANSPVLPFDPGLFGTAAPTVVAFGNVSIRNLKVDGFRGTYPNGNVSTVGTNYDARGRFDTVEDGPAYTGIDLNSYQYVFLQRVQVWDSPTYGIRILNSRKVDIVDCRIDAPAYGGNTDGIHLDGCSDVTISNYTCKTGDDGIAINNNEGYLVAGSNYNINTCVFDCRTGIRVHGNSVAANNVSISNITGNCQIYALLIGDVSSSSKPTRTNNSIRWSNSCLSLFNGAGNTYAWTWLNGSTNNIDLDNVTLLTPNNNGASSVPFFWYQTVCTVETCSILATVIRNADGNFPASILTMPMGTLGTLRINGWQIIDTVGSSYASAPYLVTLSGSASVGTIWIENLDPSHATDFCNDYSKVGTVAGPGVLNSGFKFPDSVMAPYTPYISATQAGNPVCIKIGGSVYPYTFGSAFAGSTNHAHWAMDSTTNGAFDVSVFVGQGTPLTCTATAANLGGGGSFTMFAILRSTRYYSAIQAISGVWDNPTIGNCGNMLFYANGPGKYAFITSNGTTAYQASGATTPTANTWYALEGAHDAGGNTNQLYLNGVADGSSTATTGTLPTSSSALFEVGGAYQTSSSWGHNGQIALAVGFAGLLTSTQRTWLNNMVSGVPQGRSAAEILAYSGSPALPTILYLYDFHNSAALGADYGPNSLNLTARYGAPTAASGPG